MDKESKYSPTSKLILLCGFFLACLTFILIWDNQKNQWEKEFSLDMQRHMFLFKGKLESNERVLLGVRSFFYASILVERDEFKAYVGPILANNKYIQALEWIPRVSDENRNSYETKMENEGYPGAQFTERKNQGEMTRASVRSEYFPVYYIEPLKENENALGYDLGSNPVRHDALTQSMDTGKPVATNKITLVQEKQNQLGILIAAPVYSVKMTPETIVERRKTLDGFVLGVYRLGDMMTELVAPYLEKGVRFSVFEGNDLNINNKLFGDLIENAPLQVIESLKSSGKEWKVVWQGTEEFKNGFKKESAYLGAGGIFTVFLLLSIIFELNFSKSRNLLIRFGRVLDNSFIEIYIFDATTFKFAEVSLGACRNLQYSMEELTQLTPLDLKPEYTRETFEELIKPLRLKQEPIVVFETVHKRKDGTFYPVSVRLQLMHEETHPVFVAIIEDISVRVASEKELEKHRNHLEVLVHQRTAELTKSENKFRGYFELPLIGVAIFDTEGRWIELNDRMCEIVGYSREELMGFVWTDVTYPEDISPCLDLIEEIKNKQRDEYTVQKRYVGRGGRITFVEASVGCVRGKSGDPDFYVAVVQDISLRKKNEAELNKHRNHLEGLVAERNVDLLKMNEELEKFTYTASHDLIEPLRKVITFGDMLKETCTDKLGVKGVGYIGKMQKAAYRMKSLIDDLLRYSQFANKGDNFEILDLNIIIQEVLEDLEVQIEETKGNIQIYHLPEIEADKIQMRQLFQNLISNGLKYRRSSVPPKIVVKSVPGDNGFQEILIEDNGIGFQEKYTEKIFEPFQRLYAGTGVQGSGMGLFICEKIMRRHHGTITAKSEPGRGSTFALILPKKQPSAEV